MSGFPEGRYAEETVQLQRELIAGGYLPAYNSRGNPSDDGWYGPATRRAQQQRERDLAEMPAPPKPWWRTRRMKGLVLAVAGLAGVFVPALREVDTAQLVELIWSNLDHVEQIITAVGALVAAFGAWRSTTGAIQAQGPVDTTLVARVGDRELRVPRVLRTSNPVPPNARRDSGGYYADPRGPFNEH